MPGPMEYRLLGATAALAVVIAIPYCVPGGPHRLEGVPAARPAAPSSGDSRLASSMCARTDHFFKY